jgi:hypothetical protein
MDVQLGRPVCSTSAIDLRDAKTFSLRNDKLSNFLVVTCASAADHLLQRGGSYTTQCRVSFPLLCICGFGFVEMGSSARLDLCLACLVAAEGP